MSRQSRIFSLRLTRFVDRKNSRDFQLAGPTYFAELTSYQQSRHYKDPITCELNTSIDSG